LEKDLEDQSEKKEDEKTGKDVIISDKKSGDKEEEKINCE
jgi:hypothetical protein